MPGFYVQEALSEEEVSYLAGLSERTDVDGFVTVPSHPEEVDEYVMQRDFPRIWSFLDDHDGIFLGHTHIQHEAVIEDWLILNPGSATRTGTEAEYAIVDTETSDFELHTTQYDIPRVVEANKKAGLPIGAAERLEP